MKKILLSFVLVFFAICSLFAQRDTEHWIAPYYYSQSYTQSLYLSTDSTTPFAVDIQSNNTTIGTVTISKGAPGIFVIPTSPTNYIATNQATDAFNVINKGLHLVASTPFFCTMRMVSGTAHAEIVTSKGKAGIGKEFYVVNAPSQSGGNNFTAGVLATEDNTVVTATWDGTVNFTGGAPTGNTHTFTLQKGQSFIFTGPTGTDAPFMGARIVATKPITLTNGNVNGNFGIVNSGSDAILDQSVPVERLGNTFAMVRSLSTRADLEGGIVVATEDNTQVFVNGGAALTTLNRGQGYRIEGDKYLPQGTSGHHNMLVTTSKNVYLYQLVSVEDVSNTGGFNYIPPLNCFLPRKIDEIALIDEMPLFGGSSAPSDQNIKLNILTETGATVLVNGVAPSAAQGPYPLTGNTGWVTYSLENQVGNITVNSTKAVTAGINGGFGTAGYGGYFAGFSSIPVIAKKTGDCIPGLVLELDSGYDSYQWYHNGAIIPGATMNTHTPTLGGNYTCVVTMGTCPPVTTPVYKAYTCKKITTESLVICGSKIITPTFTNSSQTPLPNTVKILTAPAHGTATVNTTTGTITYIPTPGTGYTGPDQIVYTFCGNATDFQDCEQVTLNLTIVPLTLTDRTIYSCQYAAKGFFDLTSANVTDFTIPSTRKYYPTLADLNANTNEITNPTNYFSGAGFVYVLVSTAEGCIANAKITLAFYPTPVVNEATISKCFLPEDETKAEFDLTSAVVTLETPVTRKYYHTAVDASNGTNEITGNPAMYIAGNGIVYVRVYNSNNCYAITKITHNVIPPKRSALLVDQYICIDSRTTIDAGAGYQSYLWNTGATTQSIQGVPVGEYWVILQFNGCYIKQTVSVKKAQDPVITSIDISNTTATVNVSGGKAPYKYSVDGTTAWQDSNVFNNLTRGQHTFYVKDALNCAPISVEVTVPNLINAITPNGDNVNDVIDYTELAYKNNLTFVIYDRYGNKIFTGDKFNNYKWDGKQYDKKILTGTYWYNINWNEPNAQKTPIKYTGWILVKNRD